MVVHLVKQGKDNNQAIGYLDDGTMIIELRLRLLATLEALRKAEAEGYPRTHRDFTKCRGCGYRSHCDERLRS